MVKKDVFRLQVSGEKSHRVFKFTHLGNNDDHQSENTPVNNVKGVQVSQCTRHFSNVELCSGLRKGALFLKMEEKLENTIFSRFRHMVTTITPGGWLRISSVSATLSCSLTSCSDDSLLLHWWSPRRSITCLLSGRNNGAPPGKGVSRSSAAHCALPWCAFANEKDYLLEFNSHQNKS